MPEEHSPEYTALEADMRRLAEQIKNQREQHARRDEVRATNSERSHPRLSKFAGLTEQNAAAEYADRAADRRLAAESLTRLREGCSRGGEA